MVRFALAFMLAGLASPAFGAAFDGDGTPSYDCTKAATETEKAICERWMGTALADRMLADLVKEMASAPGADAAAIKAAQTVFLKTRDACGAEPECITDAYLARIAELAPKGRLAGRYTYDGNDQPGGLVVIEGKGGRTGIWLITNVDQFSCGLDTLKAKRSGTTISINEPETADTGACSVDLEIKNGGETIELMSTCASACGMNGYMDGDYSRVK